MYEEHRRRITPAPGTRSHNLSDGRYRDGRSKLPGVMFSYDTVAENRLWQVSADLAAPRSG
jgi:hypothetical protein